MTFGQLVDKLLNRFGFHLSSTKSIAPHKYNKLTKLNGIDPYSSYMLTQEYASRLKKELSEIAFVFILSNSVDRNITIQEIQKLVENFLGLYPKRPVLDNTGGSGFHNCFWLYIISTL